MDNIEAGSMLAVLEVDTDVLYQWRHSVPTYETSITDIKNISITNVNCKEANMIYDLKGDERKPIRDITMKNITVEKVNNEIGNVQNTENIIIENVKAL